MISLSMPTTSDNMAEKTNIQTFQASFPPRIEKPKRVRSCFLTFREQKKSPLSQQPIAERLSTTRREVNTQRLNGSKIVPIM